MRRSMPRPAERAQERDLDQRSARCRGSRADARARGSTPSAARSRGPGISDSSSWRPPTRRRGSTAIASTMIPMPPSHCVNCRQNSDRVRESLRCRSGRVAPVVVNPDIDSKYASIGWRAAPRRRARTAGRRRRRPQRATSARRRGSPLAGSRAARRGDQRARCADADDERDHARDQERPRRLAVEQRDHGRERAAAKLRVLDVRADEVERGRTSTPIDSRRKARRSLARVSRATGR